MGSKLPLKFLEQLELTFGIKAFPVNFHKISAKKKGPPLLRHSSLPGCLARNHIAFCRFKGQMRLVCIYEHAREWR